MDDEFIIDIKLTKMKIKKIFLLSVIILLVSCGKESNDDTTPIVPPPTKETVSLKVMTYNIAGAAASTGVRS